MKKTFSEVIEKFNPYHDKRGRFTTAGGASSFTWRTRSQSAQGAADKAIEREKQLTAATMPTAAQAKTLKNIESRTRNLKKEQFRVVDREGNVLMTKQGEEQHVNYTVGEGREYFHGNITIHNHPDPNGYGGTFSIEDIRTMGYGPTEMRAAAPEGTYIMRNNNFGRKIDWDHTKTWLDMQDDLIEASASFKEGFRLKREVRDRYKADYEQKVTSWAQKYLDAKDSGAGPDELQKLMDSYNKAQSAWEAEMKPKIEKETRMAHTDQYHEWYKKNAYKYGMEYEFIPAKTSTKKSFDEIVMKAADAVAAIEANADEIVLDKQLNDDIRELTEKVMAEITESSREFAESITKFNPYHDKRGRFTTADGAASFTWRTKDSSKQGLANRAIEREKERTKNTFVSSISGKKYDMPELENEQAYGYREKALRHVEQYFSTKKPVKEKYDEKMKRYLEETETDQWRKRSELSHSWISNSFISAKTPAERKQEAEKRKDRESRDKAIDRAGMKRTPKYMEYQKYKQELMEKYNTGAYYDRNWHSKVTPAERQKLQELHDATVFRNKRGQWQIAKIDPNVIELEIVEKFNPYHDKLGRFTSASGATLFTWRTKDSSKQYLADKVIQRAKHENLQKEVHSLEDKIRNQSYESAALFDQSGNRLFFKDGSQDQVYFTDDERAAMKGCVLTHNHPGCSVFSKEDVGIFLQTEMQEIRATNRLNETFVLRRTEASKNSDPSEFWNLYQLINQQAHMLGTQELDRRGYREKIISGEVTQEQGNWALRNLVVEILGAGMDKYAKMYGYEYEVEKR